MEGINETLQSRDMFRDKSSRQLEFEQVEKLVDILKTPMEINSHNNFPDLSIRLVDLIQAVKKGLSAAGVVVEDVRLNGSAATRVVCSNPETYPTIQYKDLDLIFHVTIESGETLHRIKDAVLLTLLDFMPEETAKDRLQPNHLEVAYVKKMFKTLDTDRWSLISLHNTVGRNIELKFVDSMRRQYEFTVDSFHIVLNNVISFLAGQVTVTPDFFPRAKVISLYGDIDEAIDHLNNRLICTSKAEEIRGGGLLKYCYLRVSGYQLANPEEEDQLHQLMCVRFFIDFPNESVQHYKYLKYLYTHFSTPDEGINFLNFLGQIVSTARCIRPYDLQRALRLISGLLVHQYAMYQQVQQPMLVYPSQAPSSPTTADSNAPIVNYQTRPINAEFTSQMAPHHKNSIRKSNRSSYLGTSNQFGNKRFPTPPSSPIPHGSGFERNLPPRMLRRQVPPVS